MRESAQSAVSRAGVSSGISAEVTVVVPVYNVGQYLDDCLSSLRQQSYRGFEAILVDDGSTDGSGAKCDSAAQADSRFRVIHRKNGGLSAARNSGLDAASGKYILFLDSDDALHPEALRHLVEAARQHPGSIVSADSQAVADEGATPAILSARDFEPLSSVAFVERTPQQAVAEILYQRSIDNSAWGKLYPAELWHTLRFREGILYEDLDIFYRVYARARKSVHLSASLYLYRVRGGSILRQFSLRRADVLDVADRLLDWVSAPANGFAEVRRAAEARRMSANINILGLMYAHGLRDAAIERRCRRVIAESCRRVAGDANVKPSLRLAARIARLLGGHFPARLFGMAYRYR